MLHHRVSSASLSGDKHLPSTSSSSTTATSRPILPISHSSTSSHGGSSPQGSLLSSTSQGPAVSMNSGSVRVSSVALVLLLLSSFSVVMMIQMFQSQIQRKTAEWKTGGTSISQQQHEWISSLSTSSSTEKKSGQRNNNNQELTLDPSVEALQKLILHEKRVSNSSGNTTKVLLPYDIVTHALQEAPSSYSSIVHQLPSIPKRRRMIPLSSPTSSSATQQEYYLVPPPDAVHNLTYFLESRCRPDEEDRPLYVYNPMVLPLDPRYIDDLILNRLTVAPAEEKTSASYVGVFRVSNFANCHGPGRGVPETYRNYLGLALLDANLKIIPTDGLDDQHSMDVVIDLNEEMAKAGWMQRGSQNMQDCQLIASTRNNGRKKDRLVLLCNNIALPVSLQRVVNGYLTTSNGQKSKEDKELLIFQNKYGSSLRLAALGRPIPIVPEGKNMHFFVRQQMGEMVLVAS
jgi:hypothetical protein